MRRKQSAVGNIVFVMALVFLLPHSPVSAVAAESAKAHEFKAFEGTWVGEIEFAKTTASSGDARSAVLTVNEVRGDQCKATLQLGPLHRGGGMITPNQPNKHPARTLTRRGVFTKRNGTLSLTVPAGRDGFDFVFLLDGGKLKLAEQVMTQYSVRKGTLVRK